MRLGVGLLQPILEFFRPGIVVTWLGPAGWRNHICRGDRPRDAHPDRTGGVFEVRIDDEVICSRKERGRFPEIKEIKQLMRRPRSRARVYGHP